MSYFTLLCVSFTLTSLSLLVTCAKMSTEMTTLTPKSMDNPKMMNMSEIEDSKMSDSKNEDSITSDSKMKKNMDMELLDAMTICNDSFRTEMSFLIALNESGSFPDETDKTPKCFLRCMLQMLEVATLETGKIDPQRAAAYFAPQPHGDSLEIATLCAQRDEENHCEMAYNFMSCLFSMEIERMNKQSNTK